MIQCNMSGSDISEKKKNQLKEWAGSETDCASSKMREPAKIKFPYCVQLLAACSNSDLEEFERLLKLGTDINTQNADGLTSTHLACINIDFAFLKFLIENNADINLQDNEGWTPLHAAASVDCCELARLLIDHGADLSVLSADNELAIDVAQDEEMIKLLKCAMDKQNLNPDEVKRSEELALLRDAEQWLVAGQYNQVIDPRTGATPLHVAACKNYIRVIEVLLKIPGIDINAKDIDGWTPLHAAAHWNQEAAARLLAGAGASFDDYTRANQSVIDVADKEMIVLLRLMREKQRADRMAAAAANKRAEQTKPSSDQISPTSNNIDNKLQTNDSITSTFRQGILQNADSTSTENKVSNLSDTDQGGDVTTTTTDAAAAAPTKLTIDTEISSTSNGLLDRVSHSLSSSPTSSTASSSAASSSSSSSDSTALSSVEEANAKSVPPSITSASSVTVIAGPVASKPNNNFYQSDLTTTTTSSSSAAAATTITATTTITTSTVVITPSKSHITNEKLSSITTSTTTTDSDDESLKPNRTTIRQKGKISTDIATGDQTFTTPSTVTSKIIEKTRTVTLDEKSDEVRANTSDVGYSRTLNGIKTNRQTNIINTITNRLNKLDSSGSTPSSTVDDVSNKRRVSVVMAPTKSGETETQRSVKARYVRSTRRSTQGVSSDDVEQARLLVNKNNNAVTSILENTTTAATTTSNTGSTISNRMGSSYDAMADSLGKKSNGDSYCSYRRRLLPSTDSSFTSYPSSRSSTATATTTTTTTVSSRRNLNSVSTDSDQYLNNLSGGGGSTITPVSSSTTTYGGKDEQSNYSFRRKPISSSLYSHSNDKIDSTSLSSTMNRSGGWDNKSALGRSGLNSSSSITGDQSRSDYSSTISTTTTQSGSGNAYYLNRSNTITSGRSNTSTAVVDSTDRKGVATSKAEDYKRLYMEEKSRRERLEQELAEVNREKMQLRKDLMQLTARQYSEDSTTTTTTTTSTCSNTSNTSSASYTATSFNSSSNTNPNTTIKHSTHGSPLSTDYLQSRLFLHEDKMKELNQLREENAKMKEENGALIRVISKLSRPV